MFFLASDTANLLHHCVLFLHNVDESSVLHSPVKLTLASIYRCNGRAVGLSPCICAF